MSTPLRIGFAGTPGFAATVLAALLGAQHRPLLVLTQPDRRAGRGRRLQPGPVKALALAAELTVHQPLSLRDAAAVAALAAARLDVLVVAAYGLLLAPAVLALPRFGCLNVHASLLPRWRGASPVQAAILAGDEFSGVSIMQMDAGLDTGPVLLERRCPVDPRDTAASLEARLAELGGAAICEVLATLGGPHAPAPRPQDARRATHAGRISKQDGLLDFTATATQLDRQVRAYQPWPVAYTEAAGETLRVHQAEALGAGNIEPAPAPATVLAAGVAGIDVATGAGLLRLQRVQRPGGRILATAEYLRARPLRVGTRLADAPPGTTA